MKSVFELIKESVIVTLLIIFISGVLTYFQLMAPCTVSLHSNWCNLRRKLLSKIPTDINALSCGPKALKISGISDAILKNPRGMNVRVPKAMAQFVLKIEKLSHIMGPTPILEMARAYGLRP